MLYELMFLCAGRYYLVDSGYANREGYMPPYPCMRYHVKEFKKGSPRHAQELFNKYHSRLRNVIERTFGCAKSKWQLLNGLPHYPLIKQSQLVMAACALHNYVHELEGPKRPARYRQRGVGGSLGQVLAMALSPDATTEEVRDWITLGLPLLEKKYVNLVYMPLFHVAIFVSLAKLILICICKHVQMNGLCKGLGGRGVGSCWMTKVENGFWILFR